MENVFADNNGNAAQIGVILARDLTMICSPSLTIYAASTPSTSPSASASSGSLSFPSSVSIPSPMSAFVPLPIKSPAMIPLLLTQEWCQSGKQGGNTPLTPFAANKACSPPSRGRNNAEQLPIESRTSGQTSVIMKSTAGQVRRIRRRKQKPSKLTSGVIRRHTINLGESQAARTRLAQLQMQASNVGNQRPGGSVIVTMGHSSFEEALYRTYSTSPGTDSSAALLHSPLQNTGNRVSANERTEGDDERHCLVCGDKATGYNFNVVTCESCKAFFRRNARKAHKCPFQNNCAVDQSSRRMCRKCRLDKCFRVGMIKEWILSDDQLRRRKKPNVKPGGKQPPSQPWHRGESLDSDIVPGGVKSSNSLHAANRDSTDSGGSSLSVSDRDVVCHAAAGTRTGGRANTWSGLPPAMVSSMAPPSSTPFGEYSPPLRPSTDMGEIFIDSRIESHLADASLLPLVMDEDDIYQLLHLDLNDAYGGGEHIDFAYYEYMNGGGAATRCVVEQQDFSLSDEHLREVELVRSAHAYMEERESESVMAPVCKAMLKEEHTPLDVMNIMDFTIRKCVKMALRIPYFNELSLGTKTQLLKASMISLLTVRGVERLNREKQGFHSPALFGSTANISITKLFRKLADSEQEKRLMGFYASLEEQTRKDPTAMGLISVAVLFSSHATIGDALERGTCKNCHEAYMNLLARYLGSIHRERGAAMMRGVLDAVRQLPSISNRASTIFMGRVKGVKDGGTLSLLPTEFFKTEQSKVVVAVDAVAGGEDEKPEEKPMPN